MQKNIQESLAALIRQALEGLKLEEAKDLDPYLDFPTDTRFGDLTTNISLRLSKLLKKSPREVACGICEQLKLSLEKGPLKDFIREIKIEGAGFINFYLSDKYFYEKLKDIISKREDALKSDVLSDEKVLIEFVSANPTGPLSVAHARQAAVGDVLVNIFKFMGFEVEKEYYLNDEGNQINILGGSVGLRLKELEGEKIDFPENYYQGDYIYDIAKEIKNQKSLPGRQAGKIKDLGDYAGDYILKIIKKELEDFGVSFDCWYSQKALRESGKIEKTLDSLKNKGFLYEDGGALWFKSTQFGDDKDRVVIKSDGSYTYLAPDIAYHLEKYKRGFGRLINLWGPDHHGYISRLKAAVEALGYKPDSVSIVIVQLATIFKEGKQLEMSTRKGQYITLREVLDEVGRDASRFFFLMRRTSSHLDFDLEIAKKHTSENPVYYVQYAHARICSILGASSIKPDKDTDFSVLKEKEELELIKKLWQFYSTLDVCLKTLDPYMLTVYLQELAESFHKFYDLHRVLGQADALTRARTSLIEGTRIVLATGLELLGVSAPEKM